MSRQVSIAQALTLHGVEVIEIPGWQTRGSSTFDPIGSVNHHTAGARNGAAPSLNICVHGRSDLPGPLCNGLRGRDLKLRLIAAGRANHAGKGGTRGLAGNSKVWGLEVEHVGTAAEPIDLKGLDVDARIHAAFASLSGFGADKVVQHWEWTSRKIDFRKGALDPNQFRDMVAAHLRTPDPTPPAWVDLYYSERSPMVDGRGHLVGARDNEIGEVQIRLGMMGDPVPVTRRYDHATAAAVVRRKKAIIKLLRSLRQPIDSNTDTVVREADIARFRFFTG